MSNHYPELFNLKWISWGLWIGQFWGNCQCERHNFHLQTVLSDFDYCALGPESRKTHISSNASLSYPYALFTKQLLSDAKHAFSSTQFSSSVCVQRTHRFNDFFVFVKWILKKSWWKPRQLCFNFQSVSGENLKSMGSKIVLSVIVQCESFWRSDPVICRRFEIYLPKTWRMFTKVKTRETTTVCIRFLYSYKTKNGSFTFKAKEAFKSFCLVIS